MEEIITELKMSKKTASVRWVDGLVFETQTESGHRGYLDAYDARSGKLAWRFWAIPGPGEPGRCLRRHIGMRITSW